MRKFNLILTRSLILTLLAVFTSTLLNAQSLSGSGTQKDPYKISNITDWNTFVLNVNGGNSYSGKYVKLTANIGPVTTMAGVWDATEGNRKPFSGTFQGNNKTITVNYTSTGSGTYTAPFACTNGATINKLRVAGTIDATYGYAAGVVGRNYGNTTKINGEYNVISVNITGGGEYCAGVVVDGSVSVEMSSCVYKGQIVAGINSAGLCAVGTSSGTKVFTSLFAPADGSSISSGNTFVNGSFDTNSKNYYYTSLAGTTEQGFIVYSSYSDAPAETPFTYRKKLYDNEYYYVKGTTTLVKSSYYLNTIKDDDFAFSMTFKDDYNNTNSLNKDDYTTTIYNSSDDVVEIASITPGSYTLEITGIEGHSKGKSTASFTVVDNFVANGAGTEAHPFEISSISDWDNFAAQVRGGHSFSGEFLKLTDDITVSVPRGNTDKMVGVYFADDNFTPFSGTFDGNWKKLRFYGGESTSGNHYDKVYCAPFRCINGATFKNIDIEGTIETDSWRASGLVGFVGNGDNYITNCNSSIVINKYTNAPKPYQIESGGFVARLQNGTVYFSNCLFDGEIIDKANNEKCAGFMGWTEKKTHYNTCYMAGNLVVNKSNIKSNFQRNNESNRASDTVAMYYTKNFNINISSDKYQGPRGNLVSKTSVDANEGLFRKYTVDETNYYIPVEITPLTDMVYEADFNDVTTNYFGKRLVKNTDYTVLIERKTTEDGDYTPVDYVTEPAFYRVTVTGKGSLPEPVGNYFGSKVFEFRILSESVSWQVLVDAIANAENGATITLENDFIASSGDNALTIPAGKTLTIDLDGHTINRNLSAPVNYGQVIRIEAGATLNIIGPGTITGGNSLAVDNADEQGSKNDAGGIYNMGTLTLTNVTVENNRCCKNPDDPTNDKATARGGGIYTGEGSSFTMTGGKVTGNAAKGGGGGVYCYYPASFSMTNVEISNNDSESKGGGLRIRTKGTVEATLTDCKVRNCRATETNLTRSSDGGGIYMQEGKLRMENCTIGGIDITNPGTPEADTTFYTNQSAFAGAGFYQNSGETYAKNCNISYNSAYTQHDKMYGGGICLKAGTYTMDDGEITNNHSYKNGGGVYIYPGATFKVKGKILIDDNFRTRPGAVPENTDNNTYLEGKAQIHIIGDLDPDTRIHITGHGLGGVYTKGLKEHARLDNFVTDGKYQLLNTWDSTLQEIKMVPYDWYKEGTWDETTQPHETPTASSSVVINRAFELEEGQIGYADSIRFVAGRIIIRDGAQLICYTQSTTTPIEALIEKSIKAVEDDYGWYSISVPIEKVFIEDEWEHSTNLKTSSAFDLLRYDEPTHFWDSYSDNSSMQNQFGKFTQTEKGRGYLYRNATNVTISFQGQIDLDTVPVTIKAQGDKLTGFNLIGNPYTHTIYKGDGTAIPNGDLLKSGFYTLTRQGAWVAKADNTDSISICQGILVQANDDGAITMTNTISKGSSKAGKNSVSFTVANGKYEDVAYAMIDKGSGLNKIEHLNENIPMVYIRHNDEDYAVAVLNEATRAFNLCFQTNTTGRYTLKVKVDGEFRYLHLLDCITGEDIDLLKDNEYSFIASNVDDENRFVVLLGDNTGADDSFAFQNGDDLIISGNGELQIFDVAGRMVSRQMVNGVEIVRTPYRTGVYILRLVGSEIKTQKIVVK